MTAPDPAPGQAGAPPAPSSPVSTFGTPPSPPNLRRFRPDVPTSRDILSSVIVGVAVVIAGIPLGLLWGATTPKLNAQAAFSGGILNESAYDVQAGVDIHFALLALIFGAVIGGLVGWRGRHASWTLPLALTIGGLGGSLVAAQIGHWQESSKVLDQIPQDVRPQVASISDFVLRAHGWHVVLPFVALLTFLLIVTATTRSEPPELPAEPEPDRYWSTPR